MASSATSWSTRWGGGKAPGGCPPRDGRGVAPAGPTGRRVWERRWLTLLPLSCYLRLPPGRATPLWWPPVMAHRRRSRTLRLGCLTSASRRRRCPPRRQRGRCPPLPGGRPRLAIPPPRALRTSLATLPLPPLATRRRGPRRVAPRPAAAPPSCLWRLATPCPAEGCALCGCVMGRGGGRSSAMPLLGSVRWRFDTMAAGREGRTAGLQAALYRGFVSV